MTAVAGVDLGATTVRAAIADGDGTLRETATEPTPTDRNAILEAIQSVLQTAADRAGVPVADLAAVGIGTMGPLDHAAGVVIDPPNVSGVDRIPVVETVERIYDGPVVLNNDAVAGAIGGRYYGEGDCSNYVYLTISSGIGAGAIVDGTVLHGARGNAAEIGHVTLAPESNQRCGCGGTGHWEALCSGRHIPETVRTVAADSDIETDLDPTQVTASELFDAVGSDPLADRVVDRLAAWNTLGVATLVHAYDPEQIHVGGSVATNNPETVVAPIQRRLADHVIGDPPTVEVTPFGDDAVLHGAVASVLAGD
ncbi:ROK family protein [Salinibaculum salinum]|uniref:ROK family protein n=1 Tax=Salinibaculum salinum TaxID=3131996 RepID=UPI0030ED1F60